MYTHITYTLTYTYYTKLIILNIPKGIREASRGCVRAHAAVRVSEANPGARGAQIGTPRSSA